MREAVGADALLNCANILKHEPCAVLIRLRIFAHVRFDLSGVLSSSDEAGELGVREHFPASPPFKVSAAENHCGDNQKGKQLAEELRHRSSPSESNRS